MRQTVGRFCRRDDGVGLVEYSLLIALIAICLLGILQLGRNSVGNTLNGAAARVSHSTATYGGRHGAPVRKGPGRAEGASSASVEEEPGDSASAEPPDGPVSRSSPIGRTRTVW